MSVPLRALLLALAVSTAHAADGPPAKRPVPTEEAFKKQAVLDAYEVTYVDDKDNKLTYEEFAARMAIGFGMRKNSETHQATLKLADPNAPRKEMPKFTYKVKPGEPLPDFRLARVGGGDADKAALLGKPTLLNFMFAECAPCVQEVPELNALAAAHPELNVAAVTFDALDTAKKFGEQYKFTWPMLAQGRSFLDALGIKAYPSFALVAADGTVLGIAQRGEIAMKDRTLDAWIARLLAPKS